MKRAKPPPDPDPPVYARRFTQQDMDALAAEHDARLRGSILEVAESARACRSYSSEEVQITNRAALTCNIIDWTRLDVKIAIPFD